MAQQLLDSPATLPGEGDAARREPPAPALIPGWRVIPQAILRVGGEEGTIDLVAFNAERGVALMCFLDPGEEASPDEARAAFRQMLREAEFETRFPGELPVVALALPRSASAELGSAIERGFATLPRPDLAPDWVDWVAERLAPVKEDAPAATGPRLVATPRDDGTPVEKPAALGIALAAQRLDEAPPEKDDAGILDLETEPPAQSVAPGRSLLDWGASLGFAFGIVLAVLTVLALLSRTGRLF